MSVICENLKLLQIAGSSCRKLEETKKPVDFTFLILYKLYIKFFEMSLKYCSSDKFFL